MTDTVVKVLSGSVYGEYIFPNQVNGNNLNPVNMSNSLSSLLTSTFSNHMFDCGSIVVYVKTNDKLYANVVQVRRDEEQGKWKINVYRCDLSTDRRVDFTDFIKPHLHHIETNEDLIVEVGNSTSTVRHVIQKI